MIVKQHEIDEMCIACPMCELSTDHTLLGTLGIRTHLRCNACGWTFSKIIGGQNAEK